MRDITSTLGAVLVIGAAILFTSCETPPIQVTPMPDVAAVRQQNVETQKHIVKTRYHIKRWRQHIDTSEQEEVQVGDKLQSVKKDLEELLGRKTSSATPTPSPTPALAPAPTP